MVQKIKISDIHMCVADNEIILKESDFDKVKQFSESEKLELIGHLIGNFDTSENYRIDLREDQFEFTDDNDFKVYNWVKL